MSNDDRPADPDQQRRETFATLYEDARHRAGLSAAKVHKLTGLSQTVLTKVRRAEPVSEETYARLRAALDIPAMAQSEYGQSIDKDIALAQEIVGQFLAARPTLEERAEAARYLIRCAVAFVAKRPTNPPPPIT
ncbi:hypothetical protein [Segeticoccus rhizosphaerae]|uniref:hypothetical protein n=1 Tax=Segeticoccus rhizosphaerae TaxID=1104777 RepID=UPI00126559F2|nr:hypothetical protein [Segeticoccus rhizosphaerae]